MDKTSRTRVKRATVRATAKKVNVGARKLVTSKPLTGSAASIFSCGSCSCNCHPCGSRPVDARVNRAKLRRTR